jgi:GAF domain-containing protein
MTPPLTQVSSDPVADLHGVYIALLKDQRLWGDDFADGLRLITQRCSQALAVNRCSVWYLDEAGLALHCQALFENGKNVESLSGVCIKRSDHLPYFVCLDQNRVIAVPDVTCDNRLVSFADYCKQLSITSLMDATVRSEGEVTGVICWEHQGVVREWCAEEQAFACSVADLLTQFFVFHKLRERALPQNF